MRIYVASSWRNKIQPETVAALRRAGHCVYDFRDSGASFQWSAVDSRWKSWTSEEFLQGLKHPLAIAGFARDLEALRWAELVILVMPCGRSAHLELGWAVGAGKQTIILLSDSEPELMYKLADSVVETLEELLSRIEPV